MGAFNRSGIHIISLIWLKLCVIATRVASMVENSANANIQGFPSKEIGSLEPFIRPCIKLWYTPSLGLIMLKYLAFDVKFSSTGKQFQRKIQFEPGLTVITGENEGGKSLILEMIEYAWFGAA